MWFRRKTIDQLTEGATLSNSDRFIVAQGGSPEAKWGLLSQLYAYVQGFLGSISLQDADGVAITGGTISGTTVTGLPAPSAPSDATTKSYVDALALNVGARGMVRLASTANVTISTGLAAGQTLDGKTIAAGDLILLKNQTSASANGIYVAPASGTASRAPQFGTWSELPGSLIAVEEGTANADTMWLCTSDAGGTLNITAINFSRIRIDITVPVTAAQGGLGQDASAFSGLLKFAGGVASALSVTLVPQGRLTLASGVPVMTTAQAAKTTLYYAQDVGSLIPLFDGTEYNLTPFSELSALTTDATKSPAAIGAGKVNDWFVWNDAGTTRLSHGPDRASDSALGDLVRVGGLLLNNTAITNGPGAQRGTYVGTTRSNASSQLDWIPGGTAAGGTAAWFGVWNMYNQVDVATMVGDSTDTWTPAAGPAALNASNANRVSFVSGVARGAARARLYQPASMSKAGSGAAAAAGIGFNSTSVFSGSTGYLSSSADAAVIGTVAAEYEVVPVGFNYFQALEKNAAGTVVFYGDGGTTYIQNGLHFSFKM